MANGLSYKEFIELATQYYNKGGDSFVECWDKSTFDFYVGSFGAITKRQALQMFKTQKAVQNDYENQ